MNGKESSSLVLVARAALACVLLSMVPFAAGAQVRDHAVEVDGGSLHYLEAGGAGKTVVLLHGYLATSREWAPYIDALAAGHRVIAFDLPGHGRSDRIDGRFRHRAVAASLLQALDRLGVHKFRVVGHSSGALIALRMALQQPERVASVTAISTPWRVPDRLREIATAMSIDTAPPPMLEVLRTRHPGGRAQIAWLLEQQARMAADQGEMAVNDTDLARISMPVLIAHGDRDPLLPVADAVALQDRLPEARLLVLPDTGHELPGAESVSFQLMRKGLVGYLAD